VKTNNLAASDHIEKAELRPRHKMESAIKLGDRLGLTLVYQPPAAYLFLDPAGCWLFWAADQHSMLLLSRSASGSSQPKSRWILHMISVLEPEAFPHHPLLDIQARR
jgi:hypothetical protein